MKKPEPEVKVKALDYDDCKAWIEKKLGVKDLRNFSDKGWYSTKEDYNRPYQDFWHYVIHANDVKNPGLIYLFEDDPEGEWAWVEPIIKAFHEEFGEDAEYWVEW